jgi:hypothetical protein
MEGLRLLLSVTFLKEGYVRLRIVTRYRGCPFHDPCFEFRCTSRTRHTLPVASIGGRFKAGTLCSNLKRVLVRSALTHIYSASGRRMRSSQRVTSSGASIGCPGLPLHGDSDDLLYAFQVLLPYAGQGWILEEPWAFPRHALSLDSIVFRRTV